MMAHGMGSYSTLAETSVADAEEDQAQTDAVLERKGDNKFQLTINFDADDIDTYLHDLTKLKLTLEGKEDYSIKSFNMLKQELASGSLALNNFQG